MKRTIMDFQQMKNSKEKISMITAYDYPTARLVQQAESDIILVGDSLGMVVLGYDSTVPVTMEDMVHHTKAVHRGAPDTFIVVDLPFMSYATSSQALTNAGRLIKEGGADAVKLEGGQFYAPIVNLLTKSGIPTVGHIGLTPQTSTQLGGFKVQGRDIESARQLVADAKALEEAGAIMIVVEAIPWQLAREITQTITIPTIGIGAGVYCDGQVLVYHDLIGLFDRFHPKFVKQYANIGSTIIDAIKQYNREVKEKEFPSEQHSFNLSNEVIGRLYGKD